MTSLRFLFCLLFISCSIVTYSQTQHWWNHLSLQIGTTVAQPDKRADYLYEQYPEWVVDGWLSRYTTTPDNEYFINLLYEQTIYKELTVQGGISYMQNYNDFKVPILLPYFDIGEKPLILKKLSIYQLIQPNLQLKYAYRWGNHSYIATGMLFAYNYVFKKSVWGNLDKQPFEKKAWERFNYELYPTVAVGFKKFTFEVGYRVLNRKFPDLAIPTNGLAVDPYNSAKVRLALGYRL